MSDKIIDLKDAAKPLIEEYAQELGRRLPMMLLGLETWLQGRGLKVPSEAIAVAKRALAKAPKELIQIASGVIQVPRKIFPSGELGDVLYRYANAAFDQFGRGAAEKPKLEGILPEGKGESAVKVQSFQEQDDVESRKAADQPNAMKALLENTRRRSDDIVDGVGGKLDLVKNAVRGYADEFDDIIATRQLKRDLRSHQRKGTSLRKVLALTIPLLVLFITFLFLYT